MKKHAPLKRFLANTATVLLILGLAACEESATGFVSMPAICMGSMCGWSPSPKTIGPRSLPTLGVTPPSLPDGVVDVVYETQTLTTTAGEGSYMWWLVSGSLPTGLSLSRDGVITGKRGRPLDLRGRGLGRWFSAWSGGGRDQGKSLAPPTPIVRRWSSSRLGGAKRSRKRTEPRIGYMQGLKTHEKLQKIRAAIVIRHRVRNGTWKQGTEGGYGRAAWSRAEEVA